MSSENQTPKLTAPGESGSPPGYADELDAFHDTFSAELRGVIGGLPLERQMRVVDVACGDGFYAGLIAERLAAPGGVVGLDSNAAFLDRARERIAARRYDCEVAFVLGHLADLPLKSRFDLVWCAQSLYSLPEPVSALRQMAGALRPGGLMVVLENDTLHQLLLPWPPQLEIALRAAEFVALSEESARPGKFYVGRRLPAVFAAAGLEPLGFRTQSIDRRAPLDRALEVFLQSYLTRLAERVRSRLPGALLGDFEKLIDAGHADYLPRQPHFTLTWINVLAWGRAPAGDASP